MFVLSYVRARQGRLEEAVAIAERIVEVHGRWAMTLLALGLVYTVAGRRDAADAILWEMAGPSQGRRFLGARAILNCALGHMDEAFAW
jgi:hypothetical protein